MGSSLLSLCLFWISLCADSRLTLAGFLWHLKDIDVLGLFMGAESNSRSKHSPSYFFAIMLCMRVCALCVTERKKQDTHTPCSGGGICFLLF